MMISSPGPTLCANKCTGEEILFHYSMIQNILCYKKQQILVFKFFNKFYHLKISNLLSRHSFTYFFSFPLKTTFATLIAFLYQFSALVYGF